MGDEDIRQMLKKLMLCQRNPSGIDKELLKKDLHRLLVIIRNGVHNFTVQIRSKKRDGESMALASGELQMARMVIAGFWKLCPFSDLDINSSLKDLVFILDMHARELKRFYQKGETYPFVVGLSIFVFIEDAIKGKSGFVTATVVEVEHTTYDDVWVTLDETEERVQLTRQADEPVVCWTSFNGYRYAPDPFSTILAEPQLYAGDGYVFDGKLGSFFVPGFLLHGDDYVQIGPIKVSPGAMKSGTLEEANPEAAAKLAFYTPYAYNLGVSETTTQHVSYAIFYRLFIEGRFYSPCDHFLLTPGTSGSSWRSTREPMVVGEWLYNKGINPDTFFQIMPDLSL